MFIDMNNAITANIAVYGIKSIVTRSLFTALKKL